MTINQSPRSQTLLNTKHWRASIALLVSAGISSLAMAQAPATPSVLSPANADEIVITGTLIRGIAPVGAPVIGISAQDIVESGVATTVDLLRRIPQISNIGADEARSTFTNANSANANTTFASGINMRGLGVQATLVLVEGRHPAPTGILASFFDPSNIPTLALSGIDIVADGASALYGSEAIAGVANLILRKNFDGAEVSIRNGSAKEYKSYQAGAILGKTWSGGGVMVAAERNYHDALYAAARANLYNDNQVSVGSTDKRVFLSSPPNILVGTTRYGVPATLTSPATFAQLSTTPNLFSVWSGTTVIPEQKRNSVVLTAHQDVDNNISLYTQMFWSKRDFSKNLGRGNVPAQTATLNIPSTNPFFITGIPGVTTSQSVQYSFLNSLGASDFSGYSRNWQAIVGAKIKLGGDWRADLSYAKNLDDEWRIFNNRTNTCALQGSATSISGPCVIPTGQIAGGVIAQTTIANAFNPYGTNNPAVLDRIRGYSLQTFRYTVKTAAVTANGSLFELPGGTVRAAVGAEFSSHRESFFNTANNDTASVDIVRVTGDRGKSQEVTSLYAEVVIPLIGERNAITGVQNLQLSIADRDEKYTTAGKTNNPKFGFSWVPVDGIKVFGSHGTSYRYSLQAGDPNAAANITTTTAWFDYAIGTAGANTTAVTRVGGNASTKQETATTNTLGFNFRPKMFKGLDLSATYFDIDYKDLIDTPGNNIIAGVTTAAREVLFGAYLQRRPADAAGSAAFTALVTSMYADPLFIPNGVIPAASAVNAIVDARNVNAGRLKTQGVDFTAFYDWDNSMGQWNIGLVGTRFSKYERSVSPAASLVSTLGTIDNPTRYHLRYLGGWHGNGFRVNAAVDYLPNYDNNNVTPIQTVSSYTTVDASVGYDFGERSNYLSNFSLSLDVQNLFNKTPPFAIVSTQLFDSSGASPIGRNVNVKITKKF